LYYPYAGAPPPLLSFPTRRSSDLYPFLVGSLTTGNGPGGPRVPPPVGEFCPDQDRIPRGRTGNRGGAPRVPAEPGPAPTPVSTASGWWSVAVTATSRWRCTAGGRGAAGSAVVRRGRAQRGGLPRAQPFAGHPHPDGGVGAASAVSQSASSASGDGSRV